MESNLGEAATRSEIIRPPSGRIGIAPSHTGELFIVHAIIADVGERAGMGGVAVANALRRMPELVGCRIAAVTGHGVETLPSPSPFDAYIQKPVTHEALLAYLAEVRQRRTVTLTAVA